MQILHIPIQDEEILAIEDFIRHYKKETWTTIDSTTAVRLLVRYLAQDFVKKEEQQTLF